MTDTTDTPALLHLGGDAYAHPALEPLLVPLNTLTLYPGNPRRADQDAITASIRDHGLYRPIGTQSGTGHILVGNHTYRAITELGGTMIPATPMHVDDAEAAAIVARDNRTSALGGYDDRDLYDLLTRIASDGAYPVPDIGYTDADLAILARKVEAEDVFTVGTDHMLDEFRDISGQDQSGYEPEYARKTVVYLRDQAAIDDFCNRLAITEPLGKDLNYPLDWTPDDRRRNPENRGEQ